MHTRKIYGKYAQDYIKKCAGNYAERRCFMRDEYKLIDAYQNDSEKHQCTVKVFSPDISDEEQKQRIEDIKNTAAVYMAEVYKIYVNKKK